MAADRFSINKSWDHVQSKFVGTGHSDITKFEWASNQHRDTIASHIGHHDMISFFAIAQNDSIGRVRYQLLEKMLQPCGPPPAREDDEGESAVHIGSMNRIDVAFEMTVKSVIIN